MRFYEHVNLSEWVIVVNRQLIILILSQSLLFLLNTVCLAEKQQTPILQSMVWPDRRLETTIYHTRVKNVNHYTTEVVTHAVFALTHLPKARDK